MLWEVVQHHDSDYFDFSIFLKICATSRDVKASATKSEAQGHNIQRRRSCLARQGMLAALEQASELALQTVDFARWIPENPRCCSKLCRFGGRTGLWVPRPLHTRDATRLHAGARRHIYEATTPQKRVADHIGTHLLATPEYFVVCCQMCSQDVETAIRISKRCRLEIIFTKYGPGDFGSGDVQKPKIVLGVDELVLPTDGPPDSSDGNDGSETDVEVMAAMAAMEAMEARQM